MKLVIFNGSPRGVRSNSEIIINSFKNGFEKRYPDSVRIHHLVDTDYHDKFLKDLQNFDKFMIVFPLYTDAMPGIVKLFLEKLMLNPPVGEMQLSFLIHSGFPEGIHASAIVPYLEKFTHRLGCRYMGTIIKPGTEGLNTLSKK